MNGQKAESKSDLRMIKKVPQTLITYGTSVTMAFISGFAVSRPTKERVSFPTTGAAGADFGEADLGGGPDVSSVAAGGSSWSSWR